MPAHGTKSAKRCGLCGPRLARTIYRGISRGKTVWEAECREVRKEPDAVYPDLCQVLDRQGQEKLLKLADLENELQEEVSPESFSGSERSSRLSLSLR